MRASPRGLIHEPVRSHTRRSRPGRRCGERASYRFFEFLTAQIRNPHILRAYATVDETRCACGGSVEFTPGGLHVLLRNLKKPLVPGDTFKSTLTFERSGVIFVNTRSRRQIGQRCLRNSARALPVRECAISWRAPVSPGSNSGSRTAPPQGCVRSF